MMASFHQRNEDLTHGGYFFCEAVYLCDVGEVLNQLVRANIFLHSYDGTEIVFLQIFFGQQARIGR